MAKSSKENKSLPIYILNGPNINLLGDREPEIYGHTTLPQIGEMCAAQAKAHGLSTVFRQTNREGDLVDWIQEARKQAGAIIINPAGYGHTSIAMLDALLACKIPIIEVHLSNLARREEFRHHSWVSQAATGVIMGFGAQGYIRAVDAIAEILKAKKT
jgi:3-dehydroquinate dehydratase-2